MAATWDSADLLLQLQQMVGRPTSGDSITAASLYARLSRAQNRVVALIAGVAPNSLYPTAAYTSFPTCTTSDNQIFTFGTDSNGYPVSPIGHTWIGTSVAAFPSNPWVEGIDYVNEGTQIRLTNNRSYSGTVYWYGITNPPDIDATHQPSLFPEASRELIVIQAARAFALEGVRNVSLLQLANSEWDRAWPAWCLTWKTNFRSGGALGSGFTGLQLAEIGGGFATY